MEDDTDELTLSSEQHLPELLNRYFLVWIWSIILGATMTAFVMLPRATEIGDFGTASPILLFLIAFAYLGYICCLVYLYKFLRHFILPMLIKNSGATQEDFFEDRSSYDLAVAFKLLLLGLFFHGFVMIFMALLTTLIQI